MGKIKIEKIYVFDIRWLYRTSQYTIVKVDVTERNDATKRHGIVIRIWRTSAIEVTALSKTHFQKWQDCKKKNLSWLLGIDRKIHPSGSQSDITRQASWCQTVTLGTDFSICPSHPWQILIFYPRVKSRISSSGEQEQFNILECRLRQF